METKLRENGVDNVELYVRTILLFSVNVFDDRKQSRVEIISIFRLAYHLDFLSSNDFSATDFSISAVIGVRVLPDNGRRG